MEIVQVLPKDNYNIFVYFVDGKIKKYNVSHLVGKGVFSKLNDLDFYMNNCTVLNGTLAWTLDGKYDKYNCVTDLHVSAYDTAYYRNKDECKCSDTYNERYQKFVSLRKVETTENADTH